MKPILTLCVWLSSSAVLAVALQERITLQRDDCQGQLRILIDCKEALVYCYGEGYDFPHYYPVRSPSGKLLTIQYPSIGDDPHHRSIWFADIVQLAGQEPAPFYFGGFGKNSKRTEQGFSCCIRHKKFLAKGVANGKATVKTLSVWGADHGKLPVLDENRQLYVVPLGNGEYLLDLEFLVQASYGDVTFVSDAKHYAWPYVRMHPQFSVEKGGGTITNSEGGINQKGTHNNKARWVDYSCRVEGVMEGLAIFSAMNEECPPRWLTRDYGTFGPRRADTKSGRPFTLKKGESLQQHVGILIHSGNVRTGRVEERYRQFVQGEL